MTSVLMKRANLGQREDEVKTQGGDRRPPAEGARRARDRCSRRETARSHPGFALPASPARGNKHPRFSAACFAGLCPAAPGAGASLRLLTTWRVASKESPTSAHVQDARPARGAGVGPGCAGTSFLSHEGSGLVGRRGLCLPEGCEPASLPRNGRKVDFFSFTKTKPFLPHRQPL